MAAAGTNAFRGALGRIGFSVQAQNAVTDPNLGGITDIVQLARLGHEQIKRVCKVLRDEDIPVSVLAEQMFDVMRYWVKKRVRLQLPVTAALFTDEAAEDASLKYSIALQVDEAKGKEKEGVKLPEKFTSKTDFRTYDESFDTWLNIQNGVSDIPLNYIIRKDAEVDPDAVYANDAEEAVALAPLAGNAFELDNRRVYAIIKGLILDGPAWSYITPEVDRIKDGRAAWLLLRQHYGNETFMNREIQTASDALEALHYKKEFANFTFEDFTTQLTKHYNTLARYGDIIFEETKVRNLLRKITDPTLEAAKQAVRITEAYKTNFAAATNFIAASITPLSASKTRNISGFSRDGSNNRGGRGGGRQNSSGRTGRRGYGQGRGRGGRYIQHGGRGRGGRGGGRGGRFTNTNYINPEEWSNMSQEQRNQVLDARGTRRNIEGVNSQQQSTVPNTITGRTSAAISVVTTETPSGHSGGNQSAGTQFGRQAHSNRG